MKTLLRLPALLALAACAALAAPPSPAGAQSGELVVGAVLELSGPFAVWGIPQRNAIQMLADELNARGGIGGRRLKLVVYDNQSKPTEAVVVAKRLVEQDQALAILGGATTPTTLPLVPYVTEQKVPLCSMGSSNRIVEPPAERQWIFKTPNNTRDIVKKLVEHFQKTGIGTVAFLSQNDAYGDTGRGEFEKAAGPAGLKVVAWEKFGATDKDVKPQLTKIKALAPQALVVWSIPPAASVVARNYRDLGFEAKVFHDHGAAILPTFMTLAAGGAEGSYGATVKLEVIDELPAGDPQKPILARFKQDYEARYKEPASGIAGMAYDCMLLVAKGLETAGADRGKLRDALEKLRGIAGVTGVYNMSREDHNGLTAADLLIGRVKGNKWTVVAW